MADLLPNGAVDLVSTRGQAFKALGLAGKTLSASEWLDLIEEHPRLLRRPIMTDGAHVVIGFKVSEYAETVRS